MFDGSNDGRPLCDDVQPRPGIGKWHGSNCPIGVDICSECMDRRGGLTILSANGLARLSPFSMWSESWLPYALRELAPSHPLAGRPGDTGRRPFSQECAPGSIGSREPGFRSPMTVLCGAVSEDVRVSPPSGLSQFPAAGGLIVIKAEFSGRGAE